MTRSEGRVRLFLLDEPPGPRSVAPGETVRLGPEETHHLVRVLRTPPGAAVQLADGAGRYLDGELAGVRDGRAEIVVRVVRDDPWERRSPRLALVCGVVKGRRFELALEKGVELGAHVIQPLLAERSVVEPGGGRRQRWETVLRAATKQAGRSLRPALLPAADLAGCLDGLRDARILYGEEDARRGADEDVARSARGARPVLGLGALLAAAAPATDTLAWIVGPEGGWSEAERRLLADAGAEPVCLGPHRLRTETAAMAGLVMLQALRERGAGPGGRPAP